jgi:hypothetical protein
VPFDSSWTIKDTIEISKKGDTTWIKRAEKLFNNINEINETYISDKGDNKIAKRYAVMKKSFRWFNTEFRFGEKIDPLLSDGYKIENFLNSEELLWFYSPESLKKDRRNSIDSLSFKSLNDSVDHKSEKWLISNLVSTWIAEFGKLAGAKGDNDIFRSLKSKEQDMIRTVELNSEKFDSLWKDGTMLKKLIGEANATKYKIEADSAESLASSLLWNNFHDYSVRIVMPGKLTGTNGFADSANVLLWPVKSDYFLGQPYEMWAESKVTNVWAWVVSGLFLLFVLAGVIFKTLKKAD